MVRTIGVKRLLPNHTGSEDDAVENYRSFRNPRGKFGDLEKVHGAMAIIIKPLVYAEHPRKRVRVDPEVECKEGSADDSAARLAVEGAGATAMVTDGDGAAVMAATGDNVAAGRPAHKCVRWAADVRDICKCVCVRPELDTSLSAGNECMRPAMTKGGCYLPLPALAVSQRLQNHVDKKHRTRKLPGGRIDHVLDQQIVWDELRQQLMDMPNAVEFLKSTVGLNAVVVEAVMSTANPSSPAAFKPTVLHSDHNHGYGKMVKLAFSLNQRSLDTIFAVGGSVTASAMLFDAAEKHRGPAAESPPRVDKVFVTFADPHDPDFSSMCSQNGGSSKGAKARVFDCWCG